jgi:hypothetical protein
MCKHAGFFVVRLNFLGSTRPHKNTIVQPQPKENPMKLGILIGVIVAALLVGFSFVKDEAPATGSVKDNFGNNWAR